MTVRSWLFAITMSTVVACDGGEKIDDTDDTDTTEETDTDDGMETDDGMDTDMSTMDTIEGDWVSQGADVAGTLAGPPGNVVRVEATFGSDGSYSADAEDSGGTVTTFTGTYTVDTATNPHGITISQTSPYEATVQGVYEINDEVLTYDVIQTTPDLGATPATVSGGLGSSTLGTANVQTYRRP